MTKIVRWVVIAIALVAATACTPAATPTPTSLPPTATVAPSTPTVIPTRAATQTVTPTAGPSLTPTRGASPTPGAKENLISAFGAALAKIKAYRVKVILDPSRQDDPERIVEVILPDRFRQIQESDVRQIGNTVYLFEPVPRSVTVPGLLPFFQRVYLPWFRDQVNGAAQVTFLGRSVVDGNQLVGYQTTTKYQELNASKPETFGKITDQPTKIWFSPANGFPVRIEVGNPILYINLFYDINGKIDEIGPP